MPDLFQVKLTKLQLEVQFYLIQVFSSVDIEKRFLIKEFFQDYSSTITNQQKTTIKKYFIELVQVLEQSNLIESNYKYFLDGKIIQTDQLTTNNISEGFIIYEKLTF